MRMGETPSMETNQKYSVLVSLGLAVIIAVLSLTPVPDTPFVRGSDKLHHFIAYAAIALPLGLQAHGWRWSVIALGACFVFGGIIEIIQPYVGRHGEWADVGANILGSSAGFVFGTVMANIMSRYGEETNRHLED